MTSCAATTTIREALEKRARDCRIAGASWYEMPPLAQVALDGIAAELDDAGTLLACLEHLVEAAQALTARTRQPTDLNYIAVDKTAFEILAAALAAVGPGEEPAQ